MQAYALTDTKSFMNHLLTRETFDHFELVSLSLTTFVHYEIDGRYKAGYFPDTDGDSTRVFTPWSCVRPLVFQLVRGSAKPQDMKVVLRLSDQNTSNVLDDIGSDLSASDVTGLYLNIQYKEDQVNLITGTSLRIFTVDKTLEHAWDDLLLRFLRRHQIC